MNRNGNSRIEAENFLKGQMAESLVERLLKRSGNRVYRFGYESVLQNLTQLEGSFDHETGPGQQVSSMPDFVVLNQDRKIFFVEVKFRSDLSRLHEDFVSLLKNIDRFWKAKVILLTPQKPRFRISYPPYLENSGQLTWRELEKDPDLNVANRDVEEFNDLMKDYLDPIL